MLSPAFLVVVGVVLILLIRFAPPHYLLAADFLLVAAPIPATSLSGVQFDASDLGIAAMIFAIARDPVLRARAQAIPRRWWWLLLAALLTASYLAAPVNQPHLTDPFRVTYQLYRYAWRNVLYFPLAVVLLSDPRAARDVLVAVTGAGILCALESIPQGYSGMRAVGPFNKGNALGTVMVAPWIFCMTMALVSNGRRRALYGLLLVLLVRALLFSGSRGALVAIAAGSLTVLWGVMRVRPERFRALPVAAMAALVIGGLGVAAVPSIVERPSLERFVGGETSTLDWRVQERWPHFYARSLERPLLGHGMSADLSLGTAGNTPHNSYLELAYSKGIPVLALYAFFAGLAILSALRVVRGQRPGWSPLMGVVILASMGGMLTHGLVESLFMFPPMARTFWTFTAIALIAGTAIQTPRPAHAGMTRVPR